MTLKKAIERLSKIEPECRLLQYEADKKAI
jgi:hypothetical protein